MDVLTQGRDDYESLLCLLIGWYKWKLTYVEGAL